VLYIASKERKDHH